MEPPEQPGWAARLTSIRTIITIEPAIFLQTFTWGLQSVITQNLMISKEPNANNNVLKKLLRLLQGIDVDGRSCRPATTWATRPLCAMPWTRTRRCRRRCRPE